MSKQKDKRRKAQLASKALNESFKFQVMYALKQKATDETYDAEIIDRELDVICKKGLGQDMLKIKEMLEGVRTEMGAEHIAERCSLRGSVVAYLLGITNQNPIENKWIDGCLSDAEQIRLPMQIDFFYDNEVRNQVVDLLKDRGENMTSRLGQPAVRLKNCAVVFRRVVQS